MKHGRWLRKLRQYQLEVISFIVGAVELTLELTASRIAAPYIGLTIYVWTSVIGVILAALALGYLLGGRLADRRKQPVDIAYMLLFATLLIAILNIFKDPIMAELSRLTELPAQLQALIASITLFAIPTVILGAVTPYLARLSIADVASSGRRVARINAAGTFGALFGTFFTGFFLFSLVGTRNILSLICFTLAITSLLIVFRAQSRLRWALWVLAVILSLMPSRVYLSGVIKDFDTAYGRYIIRDIATLRVLQSDATSLQSGINKQPGQPPPFPYIRAFDAVSTLPQTPHKYLIIGGGAFTLPGLLAQAEPQATIDVIEIDKRLQPLSEQYFGFVQSPRVHVHNQDGRQFLNTNQQKYDVIYLDAFSNATPPFQLLTQEANQRLHAALAPGGVIAVNILSRASGSGGTFVSSIAKTYQTSFTHVRAFRLDKDVAPTDMQSILLLASTEPLQTGLTRIAAQNTEFHEVLQREISAPGHNGRLLTDDHAPVEEMVARQY